MRDCPGWRRSWVTAVTGRATRNGDQPIGTASEEGVAQAVNDAVVRPCQGRRFPLDLFPWVAPTASIGLPCGEGGIAEDELQYQSRLDRWADLRLAVFLDKSRIDHYDLAVSIVLRRLNRTAWSISNGSPLPGR